MVAKGHNYGLCHKCGKIHVNPNKGGYKRTPESMLGLSLAIKGTHRPKEIKRKISIGLKGRTLSTQHKQNISNSKRGKHIKVAPRTLEWNRHISEAKKGTPAWNKGLTKSDPRVLKYTQSITGIPKTMEARKKMSISKLALPSELKTQIGKKAVKVMLSHTTPEIRIDKAIHAMQGVKKSGTDIERAVEKSIKSLNINYESQKKIPSVCVPDFFIPPNICIFADGERFHNKPEKMIKDEQINKKLRERGYVVLRFWGETIKKHPEKVLNEIRRNTHQ